jgi:PKD repeat protein
MIEAETTRTPNTDLGFARSNRRTIMSQQRGIWSESVTWDCDCVPSGDDNVIVNHEVSFVTDAEFSSLIVNGSGSLIDLNEATLSFDGNFVSAGTLQLDEATLVAYGIAENQTLDADLKVSKLLVQNRSNLRVLGSVEVTGQVNVEGAEVEIDEAAQFIVSENEFGRATIQRTNGGNVTGLVTRKMTLPAIPNRDMTYVEQRITTGLEGVTVAELVGDFPTYGFTGADTPDGFSNIGSWSASADFNYLAVENVTDLLPVWEGIYLTLAPAESYTLTFSGTLPETDVRMDIPGDAFSAVFGNASNGNVDLQTLSDQFVGGAVSMDCWNTNTLQYDHYMGGICTNGLNSTLQPNTTCQFLPKEDVSLVLNSNETMPNGVVAESQAVWDGMVVFSAENGTGYSDECVATIRPDAQINFVETEDAINTSSLYSACDLYLKDAEAKRSSIAFLDFEKEPIAMFDVVLGANRPLNGEYTVRIDAFEWKDGCAYFILDGETESRPIETGELAVVSLASNVNHNYLVGTLYLVPQTRAEVSSPGCEGEGDTYIEVLPTGDGNDWTVTLTDSQGLAMEGITNEDGVAVVFGDLPSGTYSYEVESNGTMTCGSSTGQASVVRPTAMAVRADVTNDCGDGGLAVAEVTNATTEVTYTWSDGQEGMVATGLIEGTYQVIVRDEFACEDTLEISVLSAPALNVLGLDGDCEGITDASLELNSNNPEAEWNFSVRDENGNAAGFANNVSTPHSFEVVAGGTYVVEAQLLGDYGCPPVTKETTVVQPVPMNLDISSDVVCDAGNTGEASVNVIGGTGQVTLAWSNGATGDAALDLVPGTYTVTATDAAGCTESTDVEVKLTPQMDVAVMSPGCDGQGEAGFTFNGEEGVTWTVTIADSEGSYVDTWNMAGGAVEMAGLPSGAYNVTYSHDAGDGCPNKTMEAELMAPSNLTVDVTTTPMQCGETNAGAITLAIAGGNGTVDVVWEHGAAGAELSGLPGGQYTAMVEDSNGCTKEVRVELEETPTVVADFDVPQFGLTHGTEAATMTFTNTSNGNITGQTWYFGDTDVPSYDYHATHTFNQVGAYDVFLNVWNDKCSHTVRKTVVVDAGNGTDTGDVDENMVSSIAEGDLTEINAPVATESGWMMDLGAGAAGMKMHVFDLTGRQLCNPASPDANGQIWVEGDQWPALVLLRLVHEPTNSIRTWKMVR